MKKLSLIFIILHLITSCAYFQKDNQANNLQAQKVHLIDIKGNNWLFRGNMPLIGKGENRYFAYKELIQYMKDDLEKEQYYQRLPKDFYLVDLSLLDIVQITDVRIENRFFRENPQLGKFINWPIFGIEDIIKNDQRNDVELNSKDHQKILNRIKTLNDMMAQKYDKPAIFYFHCDQGCERTGHISAAYQMTNLIQKYSQAAKDNIKYCSKKPNHFTIEALKGYCKFLQSKDDKYKNICDF